MSDWMWEMGNKAESVMMSVFRWETQQMDGDAIAEHNKRCKAEWATGIAGRR